ncbi:MAG: glutathione S-transferase [Halieaceae bacterium]|jgi:glutathione S-transferase
MTEKYRLYGIACSLYAGKARSYLRKQNIDFVEYGPNHPDYGKRIIPKTGRMIIPVIEAPDGQVVQDGSDIIHYFESHKLSTIPAYPNDSLKLAISFLFELFGGEGLLRPAMHFRWDYEENLPYLKSEFAALAPSGFTAAQVFEFSSAKMRKAKRFFGVTEESEGLIISAYAEFLALMEGHLEQYPYLLGSQPSLGDYSLMAPLYGHLYRDPRPSAIMRQTAPLTARWVERMNTRQEYWGDYVNVDTHFDSTDTPDTLKALMRYIADEYLPEILAHIDYANQWLAQHPDLEAGTNGLDNPAERVIGQSEFNWRGIALKTAVMPYRFYLLQRLQDCHDEASSEARQNISALFAETGLSTLLEARTCRRVERKNHLEVWGKLRSNNFGSLPPENE